MRTPRSYGTRRGNRPLTFELLEDRRLLSVGQTLTGLGLPAPGAPPPATVDAPVVVAPANSVLPAATSPPNAPGILSPVLPASSTLGTAPGALPQVRVAQPAVPDHLANPTLAPRLTPATSLVSTTLDSVPVSADLSAGLGSDSGLGLTLAAGSKPALAVAAGLTTGGEIRLGLRATTEGSPGGLAGNLGLDTTNDLGVQLGAEVAGVGGQGLAVSLQATTPLAGSSGIDLGLGASAGPGGGDGLQPGFTAGVAVGSAPVLTLGGGAGQGTGAIASAGGFALGGLLVNSRDGVPGTNGDPTPPEQGPTARPLVLLTSTNRPGVGGPGQPASGGGIFGDTGEKQSPVRVPGLTQQESQGDFALAVPMLDGALKDGPLFGAANDKQADAFRPGVAVSPVGATVVAAGVTPPGAAAESLALPEPQGAGLMSDFAAASLRSVEEALQRLLHRTAVLGMELSGLLAHPHLVGLLLALGVLAVSCEVYRRRARRLRRGLRLAGVDGPSWQWFAGLTGPGGEIDS
jgi:hypothetical protein